MEDNVNPKWANLVWTRTCIPRHTFTMWLFMQNRLPILQRIGRFTALPSTDCLMCKQCPETHEHLFFECPYAKEIWSMFCTEWGLQLQLEGRDALIKSIYQMKKSRKIKSLIQALVSAVIYQIWFAWNRQCFHNTTFPAQEVVKEIWRQVIHRILQLHQHKGKYKACIDLLLQRWPYTESEG